MMNHDRTESSMQPSDIGWEHAMLPDNALISPQIGEVTLSHAIDGWSPSSEQLEGRLTAVFDDLTRQLDIGNVAVPIPGRPPRSADSYHGIRFTPLRVDLEGYRSLENSGYVSASDDTVEITYRPTGKVYLDAQYAIGLVKDDHLIAIASAGIDDTGALKIVQIQDVTGIKQGDKGYYRTGLHDGYDWRGSLVRAWENMARALGVQDVIVQGYINNRWLRVRANPEIGSTAYDNVAKRSGYLPTVEGDWLKRIH